MNKTLQRLLIIYVSILIFKSIFSFKTITHEGTLGRGDSQSLFSYEETIVKILGVKIN